MEGSLSLALYAMLLHFANAANHQVVVGGAAGLVFTPNQVTAAVDDTVTFVFQSKNHTVTQSSFANPCQLLQNATTGATGFDSAYVPVSANATMDPAWTLQVTAATPIWIYCKQSTHCQSGMVMSINAPATGNTFDKFLANAKGSAANATAATGTAVNPSGVGATAVSSIGNVPAASSTAAANGTSAATHYGASGALIGLMGLAVALAT